MTPRTRSLIVAAVAFAGLVAVGIAVPVPYVKLTPGPAYNTIGEVDGQPLVSVEGSAEHPVYPVTGALDMLTIMESGGPRGDLNVFTALAGWINPADSVMPRELLYPDDETGDEVRREQARMFSTSQSYAIAAALTHLSIPVTAIPIVAGITVGGPADGKLQLRDEILRVNDTVVDTPQQASDAIRALPPGSTITFTVDRAGVETEVDVVSVPKPDDPSVGYVGILVDVLYEGPFPITFNLQDVGGPSAGMMFSLAIVDRLTPEDLARGRTIAGTGTIAPDGSVGAIGGIRQKLVAARSAGAELFLMPKVHCDEASGYVPEGLTVAAIETLDQAVSAIDAWQSGAGVPGCPTS